MTIDIPVYTSKYLFRKMKVILKEITKERPDFNKVLDAPAGAGALSSFLRKDLGLEVVASDMDSSKWKCQDVKFLQLDLNQTLPFPDGNFDLIVCLEGLKHFGFVNSALTEFARVLKPGGYLVVTIPNDLCLQSRLRYLFDGFVDVDWNHPLDPDSENERSFLHPKSLLSLPYLYYFLACAGFSYKRSYADRFRGWSVLLSLVLYPFVHIASLFSCPKGHPLRSEMRSLKWLAGRRNIIVAEKLALATIVIGSEFLRASVFL
ncbi:MAG: class I SAM-dependent methyltransferase [Bdellovibrionales bacterium]|nr:class I SAM-dependent methyltransferase [Bdellovibrionales bacterium]